MIGRTTLFRMLASVFSGYDMSAGGVTAKRRPVGMALRNPVDPVQAARIEAAQVKRADRARKLFNQACGSADNNYAHYDAFDNLHDRFNPFYVAK